MLATMQYADPNMHPEMHGGQHMIPNPYLNSRVGIKSESNSDRAVSPHGSEHGGRYGSQPTSAMGYAPLQNAALNGGMRYPSPTPGGMPSQMPMLQHSYTSNSTPEPGYPPQMPVQAPTSDDNKPASSGLVKAFACSTCGKGFARRSDLARHERIHSGHRPHVCDYPGCGKQFIQRSALTVHSRVHTGEKPHMCERCGKPFSDSSSLARHRRIHSGKRPYKCPYADCQKTFTRRTTLTRHQNHHTGTVEEAAAATAAALASRGPQPTRATRSEGDEYSETRSPLGSGSPNDRHLSMSPAASLHGLPTTMHRQSSDYGTYSMGMGMPPHLRGELSAPSPRSSPVASQPYLSQAPQRPTITSHPSGYGPPSILEPPTHGGQQVQQHPQSPTHAGTPQQAGSVHGSPHMSTVGWQSPTAQHVGTPTSADGSYAYPDPAQGYPTAGSYYGNGSVPRPNSTEPNPYHPAQPMHSQMWPQQQ